jgi:hypothetical protein
VRGGVLAALHALVAPRPKRKVRARVGVAFELRRGARVAGRPRRARLLGRVLALIRRSLIVSVFGS